MATLLERLNDIEELEIVRQCAWCHAVLVSGEWVQVGYARNVRHIGIRMAGLPPRHRVSHGICPACAAVLRAGEE